VAIRRSSLKHIRAVVFDVGEVLIDETREYGAWADWLGVPRHTFDAVFGGVIARGEDYRQTFRHFRSDFDLDEERRRREEAGCPETFGPEDLYPDVRNCLEQLKQLGFVVGIAGNQTARAGQLLRGLGLATDWIGTSAGWGVEKPSAAFFTRIIRECGCQPTEIAYVGDRLDNDVRPALAAGMIAIFVRRGPWGYLCSPSPGEPAAHLQIATLVELPSRLRELDQEG
jgi:HAD superfamily hydrolase (TIGR01549 family)